MDELLESALSFCETLYPHDALCSTLIYSYLKFFTIPLGVVSFFCFYFVDFFFGGKVYKARFPFSC